MTPTEVNILALQLNMRYDLRELERSTMRVPSIYRRLTKKPKTTRTP